VPLSSISQDKFGNIVQQKSQHNQQVAHQVQTHVQAKLIPEPGWVPLSDSTIGKRQSSSPALTFLQQPPLPISHHPIHTQQTFSQQPSTQSRIIQNAPKVVTQSGNANSRLSPFRSNPTVISTRFVKPQPVFQQQKPTHKPIIIVQNNPFVAPLAATRPTVVTHHQKTQNRGANFEQLLTLNQRPAPTSTTTTTTSSRRPLTINPTEDTIVIQYNTVSENHSSSREQRDSSIEDLPFDERIDLLPIACKEVVKDLIKDILESPLRMRNSLLGMLRMKESIKNAKNVRTQSPRPQQQRPQQPKTQRPQQPHQFQEQPRSQEPRTVSQPLDIVTQTFNNFPAFKNQGQAIQGHFINTQQQQQQQQQPQPQPPPRQPKIINRPQTTPKPQPIRTTHRPALTLAPLTFPPNTRPPPTQKPRPQTFAPRKFVPQQIFSSEGQSDEIATLEVVEEARQGISIEQFLKQFPEVRRISSRFGDDNNSSKERVVGNLVIKNKDKDNEDNNNSNNNQQQQQQSRPNKRKKNGRRRGNRKRPLKTATTQRPPLPETTRRLTLPPTTRPPPTTQPPPPPTTRPTPPPTTTRRPTPPPTRPPPSPQPPAPPVYDDYDYDSELSSDDYSYLYYNEYYDELVPEHHRFKELAAQESFSTTSTTTTTTTPRPRRKPKSQRRKKKKNRNQQQQQQQQQQHQQQQEQQKNSNSNSFGNSFSFFSSQPNDFTRADPKPADVTGFPNFPNTNVVHTTELPKTTLHTPAPKQRPVAVEGTATQAGPFGYIEKGTFFDDSNVPGFPEMIEVIYQGFVWAMDIRYGKEGGRVQHGGVHTILKDKVKRDKVFLKDDYIVRVTGRASPYNINRLTFYTAKGKTFGPWGDRRSKESIDFDVAAPSGHALAFFSGTVDFGVPFRSISFHWRPIPS
jgi:hypothetical protein